MKSVLLLYFLFGATLGMALTEVRPLRADDLWFLLIGAAVCLIFYIITLWVIVRKQKILFGHHVLFWLIAPPFTTGAAFVITWGYLMYFPPQELQPALDCLRIGSVLAHIGVGKCRTNRLPCQSL